MTDKYIQSEMHRAAGQALESARQKEEGGDLQGAAAAYRNFAQLARKMAENEVVQKDRLRLHQKANSAIEKAKSLESGVGKRAGNGHESSVAQEDAYGASVDDLIYRSSVDWKDIGGMEEVKASLKYMMGLMLAKQPQGMQLESASRILLYGPPGTGKTLLAAACSNMLDATFFSVKASDLLSKYFGESTKLISALYSRARSEADTGAAVVFIDEIDALAGENDGNSSGPERRILATLLAELDGLANKGELSRVITIAATNRPWQLRDAVRDRFERRILVDRPDKKTRAKIFKLHIAGKGLSLSDVAYADLAGMAESYSGRMIQRTCKAAIAKMIKESNKEVPSYVDQGKIRDYVIATRPLAKRDFKEALAENRPNIDEREEKKMKQFSIKIGGERT